MQYKWCTIAPINYFDQNDCFNDPFDFGQNITISKVPEWFFKFGQKEHPYPEDPYPCKCHKTIIANANHIIKFEYEASNLGDPHPYWKGERKRSIHDWAAEKLQLTNLALWLARPTRIGFKITVDSFMPEDEWVCRQSRRISPFIYHQEYKDNTLNAEDIKFAKNILTLIFKYMQGSVWRSLILLHWALISEGWDERFLLLWVAIEALFGSEDSREITYRLSQRTAFFLGNNREEIQTIYEEVKKGYIWRSRLVHGRSLEKLKAEISYKILYETEELVRKALCHILSNESIINIFNSKKREPYLDSFIFR